MAHNYPEQIYVALEAESPLADPSEYYLITARDPEELAELGKTRTAAVYKLDRVVSIRGEVSVIEE